MTHEYREPETTHSSVIDDYQTQTGAGTSSSGGAVRFNVSNLTEGLLRDADGVLTWTGDDPCSIYLGEDLAVFAAFERDQTHHVQLAARNKIALEPIMSLGSWD